MLTQPARTVLFGMLMMLLAGCYPPCDGGWREPVMISGQVSADLHAVVEAQPYEYLAVGDAGTVVATHGATFDHFSVGSADLRTAIASRERWWVAGDGGMLAVSTDLGVTWTQVDAAGTSADLYAMIEAPTGLVIVGDGVVIVQQLDGTWAQLPAPPGGWGDLRALFINEDFQLFAVGLAGVAWGTTEPTKSWATLDIGIDADWFAVGALPYNIPGLMVAGSAGTLAMFSDRDGWVQHDLGTNSDLIAYSQGIVLTADGEVLAMDEELRPTHVQQLDDARALVLGEDWDQVAVVGRNTFAATLDLVTCGYP